MRITLHCSSCGANTAVSYKKLFALWNKQYSKVSKGKKPQIVVGYTCPFDHKTEYSSPMFRHIFQIIFYAMLKESEKIQ